MCICNAHIPYNIGNKKSLEDLLQRQKAGISMTTLEKSINIVTYMHVEGTKGKSLQIREGIIWPKTNAQSKKH